MSKADKQWYKNIIKSDTPFEEGEKAFWNDVTGTSNPYKHSDEENMHQWNLGWKNGLRTSVKRNQAEQTKQKNGSTIDNAIDKAIQAIDNAIPAIYSIGAMITAFITFVGSWIYCIATYGFLFGVGLGWLPSIIVAVIAGFLWPLIAIAIAGIAISVFSNGH